MLSTRHSLGVAYTELGKFKKSECYFKRSLEEANLLLGSEHKLVILISRALRGLYEDSGVSEKAELLYETVLFRCREFYGDDHEDTFHAMHAPGCIYLVLRKFAQAQQMLFQALPRFERHYGSNHELTLDLKRYIRMLPAHHGWDIEAQTMDIPAFNDEEQRVERIARIVSVVIISLIFVGIVGLPMLGKIP
ncbi:hypothetical protein K470DRAFT_285245 [Piedraia hortae CBS 480.64]|uniref:TPR-like protein n=1 Tax=Piedraia hortae CBS 480.64 TaxID=1314780 RepID=A0A6A7C3G6_9PEZI|nr:hypothetical protein K470DRAFT_285245 [Piedraia hortae CBS 480.64]